MSAVEQRLDEIADCEFLGRNVAERVARYATLTQQLAHDLVRELANAEEAAGTAMRQLNGNPMLAGIDVRLRARRVTRVLREAQALCKGISAESVAFNVQFRAEFAEALNGKRETKTKHYSGKVEL